MLNQVKAIIVAGSEAAVHCMQIAAIARVKRGWVGETGVLTSLDFPEYGFCNDSDPPSAWFAL